MSFLFVMTMHVGDILVVGRLQSNFFNVISIGRPCLEMLLSTKRVAVKSWKSHVRRALCLSKTIEVSGMKPP